MTSKAQTWARNDCPMIDLQGEDRVILQAGVNGLSTNLNPLDNTPLHTASVEQLEQTARSLNNSIGQINSDTKLSEYRQRSSPLSLLNIERKCQAPAKQTNIDMGLTDTDYTMIKKRLEKGNGKCKNIMLPIVHEYSSAISNYTNQSKNEEMNENKQTNDQIQCDINSTMVTSQSSPHLSGYRTHIIPVQHIHSNQTKNTISPAVYMSHEPEPTGGYDHNKSSCDQNIASRSNRITLHNGSAIGRCNLDGRESKATNEQIIMKDIHYDRGSKATNEQRILKDIHNDSPDNRRRSQSHSPGRRHMSRTISFELEKQLQDTFRSPLQVPNKITNRCRRSKSVLPIASQNVRRPQSDDVTSTKKCSKSHTLNSISRHLPHGTSSIMDRVTSNATSTSHTSASIHSPEFDSKDTCVNLDPNNEGQCSRRTKANNGRASKDATRQSLRNDSQNYKSSEKATDRESLIIVTGGYDKILCSSNEMDNKLIGKTKEKKKTRFGVKKSHSFNQASGLKSKLFSRKFTSVHNFTPPLAHDSKAIEKGNTSEVSLSQTTCKNTSPENMTHSLQSNGKLHKTTNIKSQRLKSEILDVAALDNAQVPRIRSDLNTKRVVNLGLSTDHVDKSDAQDDCEINNSTGPSRCIPFQRSISYDGSFHIHPDMQNKTNGEYPRKEKVFSQMRAGRRFDIPNPLVNSTKDEQTIIISDQSRIPHQSRNSAEPKYAHSNLRGRAALLSRERRRPLSCHVEGRQALAQSRLTEEHERDRPLHIYDLHLLQPHHEHRRRLSTPQPIKSRPVNRTPLANKKLASTNRWSILSRMKRCKSEPNLPTCPHKKYCAYLNATSAHAGDIALPENDDTTSEDTVSIRSTSESTGSRLSGKPRYLDDVFDDVTPTLAEALWDHVTLDPEELAFRVGELIQVTDTNDKDWWFGSVPETDRQGWFPSAFVRLHVNQTESPCRESSQYGHHVNRQHVTTIRHSVVPKSREEARENVVTKIINAEREYVKHLKDVVIGYIEKAKKRPEMFSEDRLKVIFSNIEEIYSFSAKFQADLEKHLNRSTPHLSNIGACFLKHIKRFEIYSKYCNNHPAAVEELRILHKQKQYQHFFEACRLLQQMIEIPLQGFLLTPVQKICKYPLQLKELLKYTDKEHKDYDDLEKALEGMKRIAVLINERKRKLESIEKIAQWQSHVEDWEGSDLIELSSELIHNGEMDKVNSAGWHQERTFFLFDHQLVYCKKDLLWRDVVIFRGRINMDQCEVHLVQDGKDSSTHVTVRNGIKLHDTSRDKWFLLLCKTPEQKQTWLDAFKSERERVQEDRENGFDLTEYRHSIKQTYLSHKTHHKKEKDKKKPRTEEPHEFHYEPTTKPAHLSSKSNTPQRKLSTKEALEYAHAQNKKNGLFPFLKRKMRR